MRFQLLAVLLAPGCATDLLTGDTPVPGAFHVNSVNAVGQAVGFVALRPGFPRAVLRARDGTITDLGTLPGGFRSTATAIDGDGTIVGQSETARGEFRAVRWRQGMIEDLGTLPGGTFSVASTIDAGVVLGESDAPDGVLHAFRWQNGRMTDLGCLSAAAASDEPLPQHGPP